jgi:GTP-binding protein HflX
VTDNTLIICPYLSRSNAEKLERRSVEGRLEEAKSLAQSIGLKVVEAMSVKLNKATPSTLIGSGKVEEISACVGITNIALVIIDYALSPIQQRNLEKMFQCKVIDRTALILEIFGARAQTNEGRLQVELATLEYQKSRLVRTWTHLERQRGGFGFTGGPGETQLELDKRIIRERIIRIKKDLAKVSRTRELHRKQRKRSNIPVVALVGYTNAGKSTLFNRLTGAGVLAENKLFATLDPTMRSVSLTDKQKFILSDTVGFVSNLPTQLVAAFRATLEEVIAADLILHVRDIAHPETDAQKEDVRKVLLELGITEESGANIVEVLNKADLLTDAVGVSPRSIPVSALTGFGIAGLIKEIDRLLAKI